MIAYFQCFFTLFLYFLSGDTAPDASNGPIVFKKNASFYLLAPSIYSAVEDFTHLLHFTPGFLKLYIKFHTSIVRGTFQALLRQEFSGTVYKDPGQFFQKTGFKVPAMPVKTDRYCTVGRQVDDFTGIFQWLTLLIRKHSISKTCRNEKSEFFRRGHIMSGYRGRDLSQGLCEKPIVQIVLAVE